MTALRPIAEIEADLTRACAQRDEWKERSRALAQELEEAQSRTAAEQALANMSPTAQQALAQHLIANGIISAEDFSRA